MTNPSKLCGENWAPICVKCQEEVQECCKDVELTLFPDELDHFKARDPENLFEYVDGTFGYEKTGDCCFLTDEKQCELQLNNIKKPVDCLIYPVNYKNSKIFIDSSCWAKDLVSISEAITLLEEKLKKYPAYKKVKYEERNSDIFITLIGGEI